MEALYNNYYEATTALLEAWTGQHLPDGPNDPSIPAILPTFPGDTIVNLETHEELLTSAASIHLRAAAHLRQQRAIRAAASHPIGRLSVELFHEIYSHISPEDIKTALAVSHVSKLWRQTALGCRNLWTAPDWNMWPTRQLNTWLLRSGNALLDVHLSSVSWSIRNWREYSKFYDVFDESSKKWRSLEVEWSTSSFELLYDSISMDLAKRAIQGILKMDLPNLASIALIHRPEDTDECLEIDSASFILPALSRLHLQNVHWTHLHGHTSMLRELVLCDLNLSGDKWAAITHSCPHLVKLSIRHSTVEGDIMQGETPLPRIKELEIQGSEELLEGIGELVDLGSLVFMTLMVYEGEPGVVSAFASLCASSPNVTVVSLWSDGITFLKDAKNMLSSCEHPFLPLLQSLDLGLVYPYLDLANSLEVALSQNLPHGDCPMCRSWNASNAAVRSPFCPPASIENSVAWKLQPTSAEQPSELTQLA